MYKKKKKKERKAAEEKRRYIYSNRKCIIMLFICVYKYIYSIYMYVCTYVYIHVYTHCTQSNESVVEFLFRKTRNCANG